MPFRFSSLKQSVVIRVPALRRESVERLRQVEREQLDALGIVANFEQDDAGVYRQVPATENLDPEQGVRIRGPQVQMGLTRDEIDEIERRIRELLEAVDAGEISLF